MSKELIVCHNGLKPVILDTDNFDKAGLDNVIGLFKIPHKRIVVEE